MNEYMRLIGSGQSARPLFSWILEFKKNISEDNESEFDFSNTFWKRANTMYAAKINPLQDPNF